MVLDGLPKRPLCSQTAAASAQPGPSRSCMQLVQYLVRVSGIPNSRPLTLVTLGRWLLQQNGVRGGFRRCHSEGMLCEVKLTHRQNMCLPPTHARAQTHTHTRTRTHTRAHAHTCGRVGREARGLHNFFLHEQQNRGETCNGCGMTIYGPNLNLVRDPRWGRGSSAGAGVRLLLPLDRACDRSCSQKQLKSACPLRVFWVRAHDCMCAAQSQPKIFAVGQMRRFASERRSTMPCARLPGAIRTHAYSRERPLHDGCVALHRVVKQANLQRRKHLGRTRT
jgi:hypothetical protein